VSGSDGAPLAVPSWLFNYAVRYHDTVSGLSCNPMRTTEGLVRCVPKDAAIDPTLTAYAYADDQCSRPAFACFPNPCDVAVLTKPDAHGDRIADTLYRTTPLSATFQTAADGSCHPDHTFTDLLGLGEALPWSTFPAFTEHNGSSG